MWSILGEIYVLVCFSIVLIVGTIIKERERTVRLVGGLLLISGLIMIGGVGEVSIFKESIEGDSLVMMSKIILVVIGGLCMIEGITSKLERKWEYGMLYMLNILGIIVLMSSKDLITLYIGLEIQSLANYVLVGYSRKSSYSTESSLKYFIVGSVGSGIILMGLSLLYEGTGSVVLEEIKRVLSLGITDIKMDIGIVLLLVGIGLKLSAGPVHQWYIDVVDGAEVRSARIISVLPKIGGLCALIKIIMVLGSMVNSTVLGLLSVGSMVISVIGGYYQRKIRRFIGYSSVGHIGYMFIVVNSLTDIDGGESLLRYLGFYALMTVGLWAIVEACKVVYIEELGKVSEKNKYLGGAVLILCLSMAGIPPLVGFYIKLDLLIDGLKAGNTVLVGIAILCTVLGGFNYLRWLKVIYYDKSKVTNKETVLISSETGGLLAVIVGILLVYVLV